jgi:hypothetical protein
MEAIGCGMVLSVMLAFLYIFLNPKGALKMGEQGKNFYLLDSDLIRWSDTNNLLVRGYAVIHPEVGDLLDQMSPSGEIRRYEFTRVQYGRDSNNDFFVGQVILRRTVGDNEPLPNYLGGHTLTRGSERRRWDRGGATYDRRGEPYKDNFQNGIDNAHEEALKHQQRKAKEKLRQMRTVGRYTSNIAGEQSQETASMVSQPKEKAIDQLEKKGQGYSQGINSDLDANNSSRLWMKRNRELKILFFGLVFFFGYILLIILLNKLASGIP